MAISPMMKWGVRRVADVLGAYAREQGWWPLDFRLYYRTSEKWGGKIDYVFVSNGFESHDNIQAYTSVKDHLRCWLQDETDLIESIGLVLRTFKQMEEGGLYSIGRDYSAVRPRDLMKRAIRDVAEMLVKYAKDRGWADSEYHLFYRVTPANRARVEIVVLAPEYAPSPELGHPPLGDYIKSRLFDEPDLLSTFDLEMKAPADAPSAINELKSCGYKEYFTISRSLIT